MADYFTFESQSTYLKGKLTADELRKVKTWQNRKYDFSFHTQHEGGWPIYIIEPGMRGQRNRPKINLKGRTAQQAEYLEGEFKDKKIGKEAKRVIVANWALFQKLAQHFYQIKSTVPSVGPKKVLSFVCQTTRCRGRTISVEFTGSKPSQTIIGITQKKLPRCRQCKQKKWNFLGETTLKSGTKPDIPIESTSPPSQI